MLYVGSLIIFRVASPCFQKESQNKSVRFIHFFVRIIWYWDIGLKSREVTMHTIVQVFVTIDDPHLDWSVLTDSLFPKIPRPLSG